MEEEKESKSKLNVLIENDLFKIVTAIEKSDFSEEEKGKRINYLVEVFYNEYKDEFNISCIEEVLAKIEEVKTYRYEMEQLKKEREDEER